MIAPVDTVKQSARRRWAIMVVATAALMLSATCGGDASPTAAPGTATVTRSQAATASGPVPTAASNSAAATATPTLTAPRPTPTETPATVAVASPAPTPRSTETPVATATATAALPTLGDPLPDVDELAAEAMDLLEEITSQISPRESATDQELEAARFLAARFELLGYETSLEPFDVELTISLVELSSADATAPDDPRVIPMTRSVEASSSGALVTVGKALEEDIPAEGLAGNVALIERGAITFEAKVTRVAEAGAAAAIVFNNQDGLFRGTLARESTIPAVILSGEQGLALRTFLERGKLSATVTVETRTLESRNVVAEKPGARGSPQVVVGGHYDTVAGVPGANDNGSGTATVLTIAGAIVEETYPFTVRFMLFGSEELGLLGSSAYVRGLSAEQRAATLAMLNFDALATGDVLGVLGDSELTRTALSVGESLGIDARRRFNLENASSDHAPFSEAGIPVVFFLADDISRIHTPEDSLDFVQRDLLGGAAVLGIALLSSLRERRASARAQPSVTGRGHNY